jgi:spore germination protein KA
LVGVASALLISTVALCQAKSFGVPYMAPLAPKTGSGLDVVVRGPVYRQERRPDALGTQDDTRQPAVSRRWTENLPSGEENR